MRLIAFLFLASFMLTLQAQPGDFRLPPSVIANSALTPRQQRLKADIQYLASDELGGRQTGSPGEAMSADFIRKQFLDAGLTLLGDEGYQNFSILQFRLATAQTRLAMVFESPEGQMPTELKLFEDFYPLAQSSSMDSVYAPVVDAGYGLVIPDSGRDDYNGLEAKGKVAIIRLGYIGQSENPHSYLAEYSSIPYKVQQAKAHGAVGVIFILSDRGDQKPDGNLGRSTQNAGIPVYFFNLDRWPMGMKALMVTRIFEASAEGHNVIGYKNNHRRKTVVICAHHDHIGLNEYENSRYTGPQAIHNGADDNASGVAAMLELARSLKGRDYRKNNYLFLAFSGEELGLLGSKYFIQNAPETLAGKPKSKYGRSLAALGRVNAVVNIDMLGRIDIEKKVLTLNGVGTSPVWSKILDDLAEDSAEMVEGLVPVSIQTTSSGLGPSDHASFYLEGIPVIHAFSGQHADYHTPSDDEDRINYWGMEYSIRVLEEMIEGINENRWLPFTKTKDAQPGRSKFKVTMGVMPDYSFEGPGLKIDGVSAGKPAEKAGIQRGDIVLQVGDDAIGGMGDYMMVLGRHNPGDVVDVKVKRGEENLTLSLTF
ncbi:MAG: hypothetical protein RL577_670 [Bacteroidota bacterium]|jgi:hypothetical protein